MFFIKKITNMNKIKEILNTNHILYDIKYDKIHLVSTTLQLQKKSLEGELDLRPIENLKTLYCWDNNLTTIICNDNLEILYCGYNELTNIECNDNLNRLVCSHNNLTYINCNKNLTYLDCSYNKLYSIKYDIKQPEPILEIPETLNIMEENLSLRISETLKSIREYLSLRIICEYNPILDYNIPDTIFNSYFASECVVMYNNKYYYCDKTEKILITYIEENNIKTFKIKDKIFKTYKNYILNYSTIENSKLSKEFIHKLMIEKIN